MGIETAFLTGLLIGQWIMLWAVYRAVAKLVTILAVVRDFQASSAEFITIVPDESE